MSGGTFGILGLPLQALDPTRQMNWGESHEGLSILSMPGLRLSLCLVSGMLVEEVIPLQLRSSGI